MTVVDAHLTVMSRTLLDCAWQQALLLRLLPRFSDVELTVAVCDAPRPGKRNPRRATDAHKMRVFSDVLQLCRGHAEGGSGAWLVTGDLDIDHLTAGGLAEKHKTLLLKQPYPVAQLHGDVAWAGGAADFTYVSLEVGKTHPVVEKALL